MDSKKEYLYVGHYTDINGNYMLKIGTTKDLNRRRREHNKAYRSTKNFTMAPNEEFIYDFSIPLSKYNTLRFEDLNRELWQNAHVGKFVRNDRFCCPSKPAAVTLKIRKTYEIIL